MKVLVPKNDNLRAYKGLYHLIGPNGKKSLCGHIRSDSSISRFLINGIVMDLTEVRRMGYKVCKLCFKVVSGKYRARYKDYLEEFDKNAWRDI